MKCIDKLDIGKTGLVFFVLFLLIGYWFSDPIAALFDSDELKWSHIFFIIAEAGLNVFITLYIIEYAIRKDRERKWKSVELLTYLAILSNLRSIASSIIPFATLYISDDASITDYTKVLTSPESSPKREIGFAIIEIAREIHKSYEEKMFHNETTNCITSDMLIQYYKDVQWRFEDIITALIPRVIALSDDEEVNVALLKFEHANRIFVDLTNAPLDTTYSLVILLKEVGKLYDALLRKI